VRGQVVPASGKRAPTGHYSPISICVAGVVRGRTYVSSVAMVAGRGVVGRLRLQGNFVQSATTRLALASEKLYLRPPPPSHSTSTHSPIGSRSLSRRMLVIC
jgi:hypothetical protein